MLTDGKGWGSDRRCLLKGIPMTHTIPGTETTRQTRVSHAVDRKILLREETNPWLFCHKPLKDMWMEISTTGIRGLFTPSFSHCLLDFEYSYKLEQTSHSLCVIRNELSSQRFLAYAEPEDTLTCKAKGNHFPHRQFTFTGGTSHCTLTTIPGLQDKVLIVWDAQKRHRISWNKFKV